MSAGASAAPGDVQRWSEELARNPGSLAFLPLARAYRRQGRLDAAMRLCLRGLEQHPEHVEAHALLALLHLESGDRAGAADEWATVLRLKPGNFEALRGMGFRYLEQGEVGKARQHLERAALIRPMDIAVQEALRLLRGRTDAAMAIRDEAEAAAPQPSPRQSASTAGAAQSSGPASLVEREAAQVFGAPALPDVEEEFAPVVTPPAAAEAAPPAPPGNEWAEPWSLDVLEAEVVAPAPATDESSPAEPADTPRTPARADEPAPAEPVRSSVEPTLVSEDPALVFDTLLRGGPVLGVLLLDSSGFVLAGRMTAAGRQDEVGALMGGTADEVHRTIRHLRLGHWRGSTLECARGVLHVSPTPDDGMLLVALRRDTPHGWLRRAAEQAAMLARAYLRRFA